MSVSVLGFRLRTIVINETANNNSLEHKRTDFHEVQVSLENGVPRRWLGEW